MLMLAGLATEPPKRVLGHDPHVSRFVEHGQLPQDNGAIEGLKFGKRVKINDSLWDKDQSVTDSRTEVELA